VCHMGECSIYVLKVHSVLSIEVCATRENVRFMYLKCNLYFLGKCVHKGECSIYVLKVHPVLSI
jgi:hypothetical protein